MTLKKASSKGLSIKVSKKDGTPAYGLERFPVTLYKEQWLKPLDMGQDIRTFILTKESQLKTKE